MYRFHPIGSLGMRRAVQIHDSKKELARIHNSDVVTFSDEPVVAWRFDLRHP